MGKIENMMCKLYHNSIAFFSVIFLMGLSLLSVIFTAYMTQSDVETTEFRVAPLKGILFAGVLLLAIYVLVPRIKDEKKFFHNLLIVLFVGTVLINFSLTPTLRGDGAIIYECVLKMRSNDFSDFLVGGYMSMFPNQLGMVAYVYTLYELFGESTRVVFRFINCIGAMVIVYALHEMLRIMFHNEKTLKIYDFIIALCFPLYLYTTFFYGNILSIMFCVLALLFQLKSFDAEKEKTYYIVFSSLCIAMGCLIKSNSAITLVAIFLQYVFFGDWKSKLKSVVILLVCVIFSQQLLGGYFQHKFDIDTDSLRSVPKTSFVAMGLQDSWRAPGWFNGYNFHVLEENNQDPEKVIQADIESIKQSIKGFINNPYYMLKFFTQKTVSQWNNPSFQGFWVQYEKGYYNECWISNHLTHENSKIRILMESILDGLELLVYSMTLLTWFVWKDKKDAFYSLCLVFVGGFIFHFFWEAKGQYTLQYFMCLIPYCVYGIQYTLDRISRRIKK